VVVTTQSEFYFGQLFTCTCFHFYLFLDVFKCLCVTYNMCYEVESHGWERIVVPEENVIRKCEVESPFAFWWTCDSYWWADQRTHLHIARGESFKSKSYLASRPPTLLFAHSVKINNFISTVSNTDLSFASIFLGCF